MDKTSFETMAEEEEEELSGEEELGAHSSPSSYRDPDETESSDEAADAKKMKDSVIHTSVNFKEGESLIDVRRRLGKQLKKDFILFDFWYADHEVEDGKTMKDFDIFHKSSKIRLEIHENSSGGRLNIEGFFENLFVGESDEDEDEDEADAAMPVVTEMNSDKEDEDEDEDEDEYETKLQEIDRKITKKLEEIAKNHQELDALHKERMKISGKMRRDGQGGGSKKKQRTAVVQEAEEEEHNHLEEEDAVQDEEDETKLQEIDRKITEKLEEIAKNHQELDALHKERMKISVK